ncbi:TPA: Gfo/Idh/MocA family oxidoreductase, partial [Candidatus Poribacteria bacterium]|nr:Gfo/Idh/MocA family oxidoreductase [Candidatus Poribacteria bacterium]
MVNVGIVGYGYAGRCFHAYLVSLAEGLNLYAVSSRSPERRARAERDYGVKTYETIDQLVADDNVDLVIIATPHYTHAELSIK